MFSSSAPMAAQAAGSRNVCSRPSINRSRCFATLLSALNSDAQGEGEKGYYHRAKGFSDRFMREIRHAFKGEDLDWTSLHPGGLTEDPGTGKVTIIPSTHGKGKTNLADLAATIVACLDHPNTIGKSFAVLDGETPVNEALSTL